ncbi:MAG: Por secretion system protein [Bacteroidaceae bacterium]|nr:Por secretion system protein [Bacteroidaceae bacterium]
MKRIFNIILFLTATVLYTKAQTYISSFDHAVDWKIYASYHNPTKAVKTDSRIFTIANGNLFSYDTQDTRVESYDKSNALSDFGIRDIAYAKGTKQLVVLYDNCNIDLLGMNSTNWNMPELKNKSISDKTFNEMRVFSDEAAICLNSGLVVIDLKKKNFKNFYSFSSNVKNAVIYNDTIYVKTASGIYVGDRADNLLDASNWKRQDDCQMQFGLSAEEDSVLTATLDKVKNIVIDSPVRNNAYNLKMIDERLLMTGGGFLYNPYREIPGTISKYENDRWTTFDEAGPMEAVGNGKYINVTSIVQDPADNEHHWAATMGSGLYEFKNYKMVNNYSIDNSPLTSILPDNKNAKSYVRISGLAYDNDNNLWMCNNECDTIVRILKKNGRWTSYYYEEIAGYPTFDNIYFDKRGWAWIQQRRTTSNGHIAGILVVNTNGTIDTQKDDKKKFITSFTNQDGISYTPNLYYCMTEDVNGEMWIGTSEGVFISYEPSMVFDSNFSLSQVKVPRDDGSKLADYLLSGVSVQCIAIDGGNRKWIGTIGNGVYLISPDGLEIIEHFTAENSPLLNNSVNNIAINGETGEVFFATTAGLCSYQGDATDPEETMKSSNLKVWPNPVKPEYTGKVHIKGLMFNSDVKIVSASGKLVAEGTSIGGEFSWDCCYSTGKRVNSGIYYALCTDEEGNKGAVAKFLIVSR